jgi:2-keto-4-pentenoate hydratase/2-oxohepta-3-ene-1,7-dioic acid hydratase in catechol pathway
MKLARCLIDAVARWVVVDLERDLATPIVAPFEKWTAAWGAGELQRHLDHDARMALSTVTLLAPVEPTAKIICIGLNYRSHVEAFGATMPQSPVAYIKAQTAVIAHEQPLVYPQLTKKLDFEIELVAIMAGPLPADRPHHAAILGYTIGNDVTARDLQQGPRGADLYSSKSLNGTCGIGPWIVTVDEIQVPPDLDMELRVNGKVRQTDRTTSMEWKIDELLAYVDVRTRLLPGDLMFTGTPAGVALEDGRFLQPGDVIEAEIERIGVLRNRVVSS